MVMALKIWGRSDKEGLQNKLLSQGEGKGHGKGQGQGQGHIEGHCPGPWHSDKVS